MCLYNVLFALRNVSPVATMRYFILGGTNMFSIGDTVVYDTQGVCKITEIATMNVCNETRDFYVLKPVFEDKATLYVPTDNEELVSKRMRFTLTANEVDEIIQSLSNQETVKWIADDAKRKEFCSNVVKKGDRKELMALIQMLYSKQKDMQSQKKHFHISDERYLKEAEKLLHEEFAFALGITRKEVPEYIHKRTRIP